MVERSSLDDKAAAISGTMLDPDDCGFAGLVRQTTDKDKSEDPDPFWMMPTAPMPAALDLRSVALPALQPPNAERVEAGSLELKTMVAVADESVLSGGILTPSPAQSDPSVEFVQGTVSGSPESTEPAVVKMPEPFPAAALPEKISALDAAPDPLAIEADIGGPAPARRPDKGTAVLSVLPAPLPLGFPDAAQPRTKVAPTLAVSTGNVSSGLTNTPSPSLDRAGTMPVVDPFTGAGHEVHLPTALMLRFESEGREVSVGPLVHLGVQTTGERPPIQAFRPGIAASTKPIVQPEPDPKLIADPPKAERLGPGSIAAALVPAHTTLPQVALPFGKDEGDNGMTELTLPVSHPGQSAGVGAAVSPAESQKTAAPILSPLVGQVMLAVVKGADGETTLTLSPEELGKVRLSFRPDKQNADRMVVMLGFDRPETMELFRRHADQLADALRSAGYAGVQIDFGGTGDGNSRQPLGRAASIGSEGDDMAMVGEGMTVPTPLRNGPLGGLDLRL